MSYSEAIESEGWNRNTLVSAWRVEATDIFWGIDPQNRLMRLRDGLLSINQEPEATKKRDLSPHMMVIKKVKIESFLEEWGKLATEDNDEEVLNFVRNEMEKLSGENEGQVE